VRFSQITAKTPSLFLELPGKSAEVEKSIPLPSAVIQEYMPCLLSLLESDAPKLTVVLEKGRVNLRRGKQPLLSIEGIQGRIALPPDQLRINLTCTSNFRGNGSIAARLSSKDLSGTANIQVTGLNLQELGNAFALGKAPHLEGSGGDLKISLAIERGQTLRADIQTTLPSLTFQHGGRKPSLKGISVSGTFHAEGAKATLSLTEINLKSPRAKLEGEFLPDFSAPLFRLEMSAREIDISPVREILVGWSGKTEPLHTLFDIVREGRAPSVSFKTHGRSPAEMSDLKNITVRGNLVGGRIFLSEALTGLKDTSFDLRQVHGDVLVSRGTWKGKTSAPSGRRPKLRRVYCGWDWTASTLLSSWRPWPTPTFPNPMNHRNGDFFRKREQRSANNVQ
jgi:hypothetical protein